MERYKNLSGDSGVVAYQIKPDSIDVKFEDGWIYLYTYKSAGAPTPSTPSSGGSAAAATLFKTTGTCGACHTFTPAGTAGKVGPNLDHLKADAAKAGQPLENYVKESIENPDAYITPGYTKGVMSGSCCKQLSSSQIDQLVQYLVTNSK